MSDVKPNPIGEQLLVTYNSASVKFSNTISELFKYNGTVTDEFLQTLGVAKYMAQTINDVLPKLINELNKYPSS